MQYTTILNISTAVEKFILASRISKVCKSLNAEEITAFTLQNRRLVYLVYIETCLNYEHRVRSRVGGL